MRGDEARRSKKSRQVDLVIPGSSMAASHIGRYLGLLILATLFCYANSLAGAFVWDDLPTIVHNPRVHQLWEVERWKTMRGLVDFSFAANVTGGGIAAAGFHAVNILIHLLCGIALFGVVRRTLLLPSIPEHLRAQAAPLAFATALIWLVHPLNTEAVTYICQRYESAAALCYLTALYALVRGLQSPAHRRLLFGLVCVAFVAGSRRKK